MPKTSVKDRIRAVLLSRIGQVISSQEIAAISGGMEWARRLRELRAEEGWKISSHIDRDDLKPGQYVLEEAPPSDYQQKRQISNRLRAEILERDGYTCTMCGMGAGEDDGQGRKVVLHVGHIVDHSHGGKDEPSNLRALCRRCNEGARNLVQEPPSHAWLLGQVRRASASDQKAILDWLKKKFR